ncbi:hypothetical protein I302_105389 [Kwoniella bestiolae CBS 10118]|uniref:Uncharacterized protein n=1 Tax=Kwoniella bestiolae CBS 10118 TaxID=1296100 RepID=A0A1B9FSY9_9TREE|nr:hypothetical protein I302_08670 [Kwoniella bestiolae CBS 10118]OCF21891.1 hypothetical protein I302_08670 [Kwoniella bestiolae CBS 10118]
MSTPPKSSIYIPTTPQDPRKHLRSPTKRPRQDSPPPTPPLTASSSASDTHHKAYLTEGNISEGSKMFDTLENNLNTILKSRYETDPIYQNLHHQAKKIAEDFVSLKKEHDASVKELVDERMTIVELQRALESRNELIDENRRLKEELGRMEQVNQDQRSEYAYGMRESIKERNRLAEEKAGLERVRLRLEEELHFCKMRLDRERR